MNDAQRELRGAGERAGVGDLHAVRAGFDGRRELRAPAGRERLRAALSQLDFLQVYPSSSNFLLCRVRDRDARQLKLALEQDGILVRYFDKPGLRDCIRISVGKPEHTEALLEALSKVTRKK